MFKSFISLVLGVALTGCATKPPVKLNNQFVEADVAWSKVEGNSEITGSALMQTLGGIPRTCAGRTVALVPESKYSTERMLSIYGNISKGFVNAYQNTKFDDNPQGYIDSVRTSICDAQGNFEFNKIPKGRYYVTTQVIWSVNHALHGGFLMRQVEITDSSKTRVVLAP
jgi:hypothetical protein